MRARWRRCVKFSNRKMSFDFNNLFPSIVVDAVTVVAVVVVVVVDIV